MITFGTSGTHGARLIKYFVPGMSNHKNWAPGSFHQRPDPDFGLTR